MPRSEDSRERDDAVEAAFLEVVLARNPTCAATARGRIRDAAANRLSAPAIERAMLAVSELVSNAWKHGQGAITLKAGYRPGALRIEVIDEGHGAVPAIREHAGDSSGGWGLRIVDEVALRWGCFEGTTHVWADLPLV
jgi:anti-sigma regulatory factor (Ser/Thr protein kinase)